MAESERKKQLECELAKFRLELREDSALCADYIAGCSTMDLCQISAEMAGMHWLYNYTTYAADVKCIKDHLIKMYGVHKGVWRNAAKCAKLYHLSTGVPAEWPWLVIDKC